MNRLAVAGIAGELLEHIRPNLAEMFAEVPAPVGFMFIGMVAVGIPVGLWVVYHGGQAIRQRNLAGGVVLVGIGLVMTVMALALLIVSVEERFGYPILS